MAEQEEVSVSEKISEVTGILKRRRWWILGTPCVVAIGAAAVTMHLPKLYTSEAMLIAVQQQVSSKYVDPGTETIAADMVTAMSREILSRARLAEIVKEYDLYPETDAPPEMLADRMREAIVIEPMDAVGRYDYRAFKLSFTGASPKTAQAVTGKLATVFISQNDQLRTGTATRTSEFISGQLEAAKVKLDRQERQVAAIRGRMTREQIQQAQGDGAVSDLKLQRQDLLASLNRARQQRSSFEPLILGQLATLRNERSNLLTKYTTRHAEVIRKDQQIQGLEALLERLRNMTTASPPVSSAPEDATVIQIRGQLDANAFEIKNLMQEEQQLREEIANAPRGSSVASFQDQELMMATRDYDIYKKEYEDLMRSQSQAQKTVALESSSEGERFRLTDPPTLPTAPSSPDTVKLNGVSIGAGLVLGLALAMVMELKNPTYHSEMEVGRAFSVPMVLGVPVIRTQAEIRGVTWRRAGEILGATAMLLLVAAVELYVMRQV